MNVASRPGSAAVAWVGGTTSMGVGAPLPPLWRAKRIAARRKFETMCPKRAGDEIVISVREHCIPASDIICQLDQVCPLPPGVRAMDSTTAGGLLRKLEAIVYSEYFNSLPETATIKSGAVEQFPWSKNATMKEAKRILQSAKGWKARGWRGQTA